eukprot:CFRG3356T1
MSGLGLLFRGLIPNLRSTYPQLLVTPKQRDVSSLALRIKELVAGALTEIGLFPKLPSRTEVAQPLIGKDKQAEEKMRKSLLQMSLRVMDTTHSEITGDTSVPAQIIEHGIEDNHTMREDDHHSHDIRDTVGAAEIPTVPSHTCTTNITAGTTIDPETLSFTYTSHMHNNQSAPPVSSVSVSDSEVSTATSVTVNDVYDTSSAPSAQSHMPSATVTLTDSYCAPDFMDENDSVATAPKVGGTEYDVHDSENRSSHAHTPVPIHTHSNIQIQPYGNANTGNISNLLQVHRGFSDRFTAFLNPVPYPYTPFTFAGAVEAAVHVSGMDCLLSTHTELISTYNAPRILGTLAHAEGLFDAIDGTDTKRLKPVLRRRGRSSSRHKRRSRYDSGRKELKTQLAQLSEGHAFRELIQTTFYRPSAWTNTQMTDNLIHLARFGYLPGNRPIAQIEYAFLEVMKRIHLNKFPIAYLAKAMYAFHEVYGRVKCDHLRAIAVPMYGLADGSGLEGLDLYTLSLLLRTYSGSEPPTRITGSRHSRNDAGFNYCNFIPHSYKHNRLTTDIVNNITQKPLRSTNITPRNSANGKIPATSLRRTRKALRQSVLEYLDEVRSDLEMCAAICQHSIEDVRQHNSTYSANARMATKALRAVPHLLQSITFNLKEDKSFSRLMLGHLALLMSAVPVRELRSLLKEDADDIICTFCSVLGVIDESVHSEDVYSAMKTLFLVIDRALPSPVDYLEVKRVKRISAVLESTLRQKKAGRDHETNFLELKMEIECCLATVNEAMYTQRVQDQLWNAHAEEVD